MPKSKLRYKFFSTKGMDTPPAYHSFFRIGWYTGTCVLRTKWFIVMDRHKIVFGNGEVMKVNK